MDVIKWLRHFEGNRGALQVDWGAPVTLGPDVRDPVAASLAVFQLGETGDGGTLRRYAARYRGKPGFARYEEALAMFVKEENRHAAMLARMVRRLGGELIEKQWTAAVFKRLRRPLNLEFELQILLTAELLAEAYYEILRRRVDDGPIRTACARILKDEVGHTSFHAEFFGAVQRRWRPWWRRAWRTQFGWIHRATCAVVWWDHRACFRALEVPRREYAGLCRRARRTFLRRMEGEILGGGAGSRESAAARHAA